MMLKKSLISLTLLPLGIAFGCSDGGSIHNVTVEKPTQTPEKQLIENCYLIRRAVWTFADENNGEYPGGLDDTSLAGNTLIDLLPGGERLINPFTGRRTVPEWFDKPGQTSYRPYPGWPWPDTRTGYVITGFGESAEIMSLSENYPDSLLALERLVLANCYTLREAVEAWAAVTDYLYYPSDVNIDKTPTGKNVIDFLPAGWLLENPYTHLRTEPRNGAAANPGETGYSPLSDGSSYIGYIITGWGKDWSTVLLVKDPRIP
jgi:hypothetical protein